MLADGHTQTCITEQLNHQVQPEAFVASKGQQMGVMAFVNRFERICRGLALSIHRDASGQDCATIIWLYVPALVAMSRMSGG